MLTNSIEFGAMKIMWLLGKCVDLLVLNSIDLERTISLHPRIIWIEEIRNYVSVYNIYRNNAITLLLISPK
jgi:hypothetical protein